MATPGWIAYALVSEAVAVVVTVASLAVEPGTGRDLVWFAALLAMGLTQAETWRHIERMRRWMAGHVHINVTSIWALAGVLLLSPGWAALLGPTLYLHLWIRVWRHVRTRPAHRIAVSTAWIVLACWAASTVLTATGLGTLADSPAGAIHAAAVVLAAATAFELVNLVGAALSIFLYTETRSPADLVGTRVDNALEVLTLCLGGITAAVLVHQPALVALTYPPILLLHTQVLVKQLGVAVATDEKTGLFTNTTWHHIAIRELDTAERSSGTLAIFMVDVDHFKKVNDNYGHLAGDTILRAVATAISQSVRLEDCVGRFGGEEFIVLLPDIAGSEVGEVAERVRLVVNQLAVPIGDEMIDGLSVSVGTATYPATGSTLDRLIHAADTALLRAKRTGRNRVSHADDISASAHR